MSKVDKKIISIFLVLIILVSQFSMVFAGGSVDIEITKKSLEEYLLTFDVMDQNNDGKLEELEYENIQNLELQCIEDFTGIQYMKNLKSLKLVDCDYSVFDIGNFENLESLYIDAREIVIGGNNNIDFSKMPNLKALCIYNHNFETLDLTPLTKLEHLQIFYGSIEKAIFPEFTRLKNIDLYYGLNSGELDLTKCNDIKSMEIISTSENFTVEVPNDLMVAFFEMSDRKS